MDDPHNALINAYKSYVDNVQFFQKISLDAMRCFRVEEFLDYLQSDANQGFELEHVHLVLGGLENAPSDLHPALRIASNPAIASYHGGNAIVTRPVGNSIIAELAELNGKGSEAVLNIASDEDNFEAILVLTSKDPQRFVPDQTTDLMEYYRSVLAIKLEQWLDR